MKKKTVNLSVVKATPEEHRAAHQTVDELWTKAEESWKIPRDEIKNRVQAIRNELESQHRQLEGAPFDISCDDMPLSLDRWPRKELLELVASANPLVDGLFGMIDAHTKNHGCDESLDFNAKLFLLKMEAEETGFKIGVLAGAIFAGCSKDQVDKYERGLAFALSSNSRLAKY